MLACSQKARRYCVEHAPQGRQPVSARLRRSRDHVQGLPRGLTDPPDLIMGTCWPIRARHDFAVLCSIFSGTLRCSSVDSERLDPLSHEELSKNPPRDIALQHLDTKNSPHGTGMCSVPGTHRIVRGKRPICIWSATPRLPHLACPASVRIRTGTAATWSARKFDHWRPLLLSVSRRSRVYTFVRVNPILFYSTVLPRVKVYVGAQLVPHQF